MNCASRCRSVSSTTRTATSSSIPTRRSAPRSRTCSPSSPAPAPPTASSPRSPTAPSRCVHTEGVWDGQLRWGKLTHGRVIGLLSNPAYAGAYVYGRHRTQRTVQPDGTVTTSYPRVPREQWPIVITGHHDGYITWQQFLDIE
ncbi:recombinase family protein, partial [Streptomyces sp. KLMMK]|uniref:recombinase family protein n=1 Tax=Streptomyces sp. KLMMK TaxID=3109353 RepID=UPI003FA6E1AB